MHRNINKRLFSLLLAAAMMVNIFYFSIPAQAALGNEPILINQKNMTTNQSGVGWYWTASTRTLTLNGFTYEGANKGIYIDDNRELNETIHLVINGENIIKSTAEYSIWILCPFYTNFNISGSGTLTGVSTNPTAGMDFRAKKIKMTGGTLISNAPSSSNGVLFQGDLLMQGGAITGTGQYGIYFDGLEMTGGTITGIGSADKPGVFITAAGKMTSGTINSKKNPLSAPYPISCVSSFVVGSDIKVINGIKHEEGYSTIDPNANDGFVTLTSGYTITYDTNGGDAIANGMCTDNLTAALLPTPTKTGHTFDDWYYDTAFTKPAKAGDAISAATTLYAKWTAKPYALTVKAGSNITAVSATSSLDGKLTLDENGKTSVTFGAEVTLTATSAEGTSFFLWDNSGYAMGGTKDQSTQNPYRFTMPAATSAVVFTASGLGGVEAKGTLEIDPYSLLGDCATTVSITKDSAVYSDFAGLVTLRDLDGDTVVYTLTGSGGTRSGNLPQDGKTYAVWVDAANSGKTVTLTGNTAKTTVACKTYTVSATKDGTAGYNPGVIAIEYPKGSFVTNGAVLPTASYDVYVDGKKAGTTAAALEYFTATFSDGTTPYASGSLWAPQVVAKGGYATPSTIMPTAEGKSFIRWDKPVETTKINAATTFTAQWENHADCEVKWVIDGTTTYGTLKQGLDATSAANGGYIEVQKNAITLGETGELHPSAILNIPKGKTVNTGGKLTTKGAVENAGTINGGLVNSGIITNSGTIATLTSSGSVSGGTIGTLTANTGTVKGATLGTVTSNSEGTLDSCTIKGGTNISGTIKGYTYANNGVTFSGANAATATVNIQGGASGFAGLQGTNQKLGANLVVRETIATSDTLDLNGHNIRGAEGADNTKGVTPIKTNGHLTITGAGQIQGGAGGNSTSGAAGVGGHGIDATGNYNVVLDKDASVLGGQGGAGASVQNGANGGCGIHGSNHSTTSTTGTITVSGSAQGGNGGPGVGSGSKGGTGGYAVCGDIILDGGGSMDSGPSGDGRAEDPTDDTTMGEENKAETPNISGTLKYGVITKLSYLGAIGDAFADKDTDHTLTLSPKNNNQYVSLPNSVSITMGDTVLAAGTGYTYNKTTGEVVVKNPITAAVTITAIGKVAETATVTTADQLEDALEVPVKNIIVNDNISMSANGTLFENGVLTVNKDKTLTLNGKTLTNQGVIIVNGTLVGSVTNESQGLVLDLPTAVATAPYDKLTGLKPEMTYTIGDKTYTANASGEISIPDAWCATSISIAQSGRGHTSLAQTLDLTAVSRAEAPSTASFAVTQPTAITGAGSTGSVAFAPDKGGNYEYSRDGGNTWLPFPALPGSVDNLPQGTTILIRMSSSGTTPASKTLTVTINIFTGSGSSSTQPPVSGGNVPVIVDGISYNIGSSVIQGDTTTITVNQKDFLKQLESAKDSVVIPISTKSDVLVAQLVVQNVADMQAKNMTLSVKTDNISFDIGSRAVDINKIKAALGQDADLSNSPLTVMIAKSGADIVKAITNTAGEQSFQLTLAPMEFSITANYGGKSIELDRFLAYISRDIEITKEQAQKITTAVVYEANGTVRHVPTEVFERGGKYFARVHSRTSSTYALIYNEASFTDAQGKWYEAAVNEMGSRKILEGVGDGLFAGERSVTRAEFTAIIVRALGLPSKGNSAFADVPGNAWYQNAVAVAAEYGIILGRTATVFDPSAPITREEAMAMLHRASQLTPYQDNGEVHTAEFADYGSQSAWATKAVDFNLNNSFIVGSEGYFRPSDDISRAEVCTVVLRLLQKAELVDVRSKV